MNYGMNISNQDFHSFETGAPLLALLLLGVSWLLHRYKSTPHPMTLGETLANVVIFVIWRFGFFAGGLALQFWIFTKISNRIPWQVPNTLAFMMLAVLVADFLYYWKHRAEHRVNLLWTEHSVHHSSQEFNLSTSLRLPWIGSYMNWIFFVPALGVGFSPAQILFGHQVVLAYQYLVHTEFVRKLGVFELLLNTPSHHRVHHGRNPAYLDKNYAGIFILWDHLFGTFAPEQEPVEFGITSPVNSQNPFVINVQPWLELYKNIKQARTPKNFFQILVMSPGHGCTDRTTSLLNY